MLLVHGWCVLQADHSIDRSIDQRHKADRQLFDRFREWVAANDPSWMDWRLVDHLNNHTGLLSFVVSRNHRAHALWPMLDWIAASSPRCFGVVYVFDDEDGPTSDSPGRGESDFSNVYRVHVVRNGEVQECEDPFLGPVFPNLFTTD